MGTSMIFKIFLVCVCQSIPTNATLYAVLLLDFGRAGAPPIITLRFVHV